MLIIFVTDDWRCDQNRWVNQGVRRLPRKKPHIKKMYFQLNTQDGVTADFVKHAYELLPPSNSTTVLIHYLGDEKAAVPYEHGNYKRNDGRVHIRTCPSVLKSLENDCKVNPPAKIYKKRITHNPPPETHIAVKQPRDIKQVKNIRFKTLGKQRLSYDAIYNLHELAADLPDFIQYRNLLKAEAMTLPLPKLQRKSKNHDANNILKELLTHSTPDSKKEQESLMEHSNSDVDLNGENYQDVKEEDVGLDLSKKQNSDVKLLMEQEIKNQNSDVKLLMEQEIKNQNSDVKLLMEQEIKNQNSGHDVPGEKHPDVKLHMRQDPDTRNKCSGQDVTGEDPDKESQYSGHDIPRTRYYSDVKLIVERESNKRNQYSGQDVPGEQNKFHMEKDPDTRNQHLGNDVLNKQNELLIEQDSGVELLKEQDLDTEIKRDSHRVKAEGDVSKLQETKNEHDSGLFDMDLKREKEPHSTPATIIDVETYTTRTTTFEEYWVQSLQLSVQDKDSLCNREWLSDTHISAANTLLLKQYPQQNGLKNTVTLYEGYWHSQSVNFVQIVNVNRSHWICTSNIGCPIDVFDSIPAYSIDNQSLNKQIAAMLHTNNSSFKINFINVQRQAGVSDCGLFAIANAVSLCCGSDPHMLRYDQSQMRSHLYKCFQHQSITSFPLKETGAPLRANRQKIASTVTVPVYCSCRGPNSGKMIHCDSCSQWFHDTCQSVPPKFWNTRKVWKCTKCTTST